MTTPLTATTENDREQARRLVDLAWAPHDELPERTELPVQGALPTWLRGQLLRNGPGRWEFDGTEVHHWFDGMSLVHSFEFNAGKVHYRNRFIRSRAYRAFRDSGKLAYSEFASDPCRTRFQRLQSIFKPQVTDNPAVNSLQFGDRAIALSETPIAFEFDRTTLETVGVAYKNPDTFATAHPHADEHGGMINLSCKLGPRSSQSFFTIDPVTLERRELARLPRQRPTYQHSFGMTERWLVFTEFPLSVNPLDILRTGRPFIENFRYKPEEGTTITLIDRKTGAIGGTWKAEPGFCFHHANAWEDESGDVHVDLCRFDDPSIVDNLRLDAIRTGVFPQDGQAYLHRYTLRAGEPRARERRVSEQALELPRINYRDHRGRAYRYVYGVGDATGEGAPLPFDRLVKVDVHTGQALTWHEPNCFAGEPVFVNAPDGTAEDDGVLLSLVLDGTTERSMLLVLDARDLSEIARAQISRAVPPGFHGNFSTKPV